MTVSGGGTPVPPVFPSTTLDDDHDTLGEIVETLIDGVRGYRTAADHVDDAALASFLRARGERRRGLVEELLREVPRASGLDVDFDGTAAGGVHRAWITIEGALAGDGAVIKSAIRGEEHALEDCEEALGDGLLEPAAAVVRKISADVREAIEALSSRV